MPLGLGPAQSQVREGLGGEGELHGLGFYSVSSFRHHVTFLRGFPCGKGMRFFEYG